MSDEAPVLVDRATAARIRDSLDVLKAQAYDELKRLGARIFTDEITGQPKSHLDHAILYRSMAGGRPGVQHFRGELSEMSDEALVSAAYLCEILNFVQWARICLARGDDIWDLFSVTLERLSAVPINDLVAAWKHAGAQKRGGQSSPRRKAAAVKLLQRILRKEGNLRAGDLWRLAGSEDHNQYWQVELDDETYEFEKDEDGNLGISRLDVNGGNQRLKSQAFNSTFQRWCQKARDTL